MEKLFGINEYGFDGRWVAWSAIANGNSIEPGSFERISTHETESEANDAANAARESMNKAT